jgi:molybdopterin-binding protein
MNRIRGIIHAVQSDGHLTFVDVIAGGDLFTSLVIDTADERLRKGNAVNLLFKESDTSLALFERVPISCCNRWAGPVVAMVPGNVVTRVTIDYHGIPVSSIVLTKAVQSLAIHVGLMVLCFVKSSSLIIDYGDGRDG